MRAWFGSDSSRRRRPRPPRRARPNDRGRSASLRLATETPMTTKTLVPAHRLSPSPEHITWARPGQAIDPSHCPIDHALGGPPPNYLSAKPTDPWHLHDGTMNYEGFFRQQLHDLHMEGNYRVFCDLERQAGNFPRATRFNGRVQSTVTVWCSNDYL